MGRIMVINMDKRTTLWAGLIVIVGIIGLIVVGDTAFL